MTFTQTINIICDRHNCGRKELAEELEATMWFKYEIMLKYQIWDQVRDHICFPVKAVVCHQTSRFYK